MKKERKDATQAYRSVLLLLVPVPAREGKAPVAEGDGAQRHHLQAGGVASSWARLVLLLRLAFEESFTIHTFI